MLLRKLFISLFVSMTLLISTAHADTSTAVVPPARDLSQDALQADKKRLPILIMFSAEYCEFCKLVVSDFLQPMIYSGDYKDKVIIRIVKIDDADELIDFNGKKLSFDDFALQQKVWLTPTLKLYDADGNELVPEIVGINTVDFFGGYLDDAINKSLRKIRQRDPFDGMQELAKK